MSGILRTDEELLKCAPPVDIAMFLEAKDNMIAQDYGKYCNSQINIYVMWPGSGDDPEPQSTLKRLLMRRPGCQLNYLNYSPTERRWWRMGSAVQPRLSELNYKKDKCTLTVTSGC